MVCSNRRPTVGQTFAVCAALGIDPLCGVAAVATAKTVVPARAAVIARTAATGVSRGHLISAATSIVAPATAAHPMAQRLHTGPNSARCSRAMPQAAANSAMTGPAGLLQTEARPINAPMAGANAIV